MNNQLNNLKIFFLTLYNNEERINNVKKQIHFLLKNNINNYNIFFNYKWPKSIISELKHSYKYLDGAFSCLSGHYAIMQNALYNNYDYIIICEDDIILNQNFVNLYNNLINIDFYFDYINLYPTPHNLIKLTDNNIYDVHGDFFKVKELYMWRFGCYIISKKFMQTYCNYVDKYIKYADYPINDETFKNELEIYFVDINCKYSSKLYCNINNFETTI